MIKAGIIMLFMSIPGVLVGCDMSGSSSIDAEPFVIERGVFAPRISFASPPEDGLTVRIVFGIDSNGRAVNAEIGRTSGIRGLDVAALRSVQETRFDVEKAAFGKKLYLDYDLTDRYLPKERGQVHFPM